MNAYEFYVTAFSNAPLFFSCMAIATFALFLTVRTAAIAGYLDPIHFYWTFTFGTAYGIVVALYALGHVANHLFVTISSAAILFVISFRIALVFPIKEFGRAFTLLLVPTRNRKAVFNLALVAYGILLATILYSVGAGLFAEINRFEQNRGFGALVRIADAARLFFIAYFSISFLERKKNFGWSISTILAFAAVSLLTILSSVVNGAKFAFLEALYVAFVAAFVFYGKKPKFRIGVAAPAFLISLAFALVTLSVNLTKAGVNQSAESEFLPAGGVLTERLALRVLANADKYYLGLPNNVIDNIEIDNALVRFISPIIGTTRMSSFVGYDVGNLNVGKQILLYHDPGYEYAGGPTSHFDLFSYKYFGIAFGWLWVTFTGFLLASIASLSKHCKSSVYASSLMATLWLRSLPILLEPPVGMAYALDVILIFMAFRLSSEIFPSRSISPEAR